jgi:hypothetical protein
MFGRGCDAVEKRYRCPGLGAGLVTHIKSVFLDRSLFFFFVIIFTF